MSEVLKPAPPPYSPPGTEPGYIPPGPPGYGPYTGPAPAYGFVPQGDPNQPHVVPPAPGYGATVVNMPSQIIVINGCPTCRQGTLEDEYSCLGIFCAIFFFPLGVLCCLLMRERRCTNCRAVF